MLENYFTEVKMVDRPSYDDLYETTTSGSTRPPTTPEVTTQKLEPPSEDLAVNKTAAPPKKGRRTIRKVSKSKVSHERIKRLAKRFLGIDLDESTKSEVSGLSANRIQSENITGKNFEKFSIIQIGFLKANFYYSKKLFNN